MATTKKLFNIDSNLAKELESVAKIMKKTQKEIVENALDFYFDYTDTLVADDIAQKIDEGKMKTYSKEEAYRELGI
ncbi:MAG: hypothetical protein GXO12_05780 [Epsilonproteobacteria bacterium]|nr:hypothetical protein [Campylobacterota bacterium]